MIDPRTVIHLGAEIDQLLHACAQLETEVAELKAHACQENHLHPDWSKLEATRDSLRDGWKREKRLQAVLAREVMAFDGDLMRCRLCSTDLSIFSSEPHPHAASCPLAYRDGPPTLEEELTRLAERCKAGVHLTINGHRDYYETIEQHLAGSKAEDLTPDMRKKMIERDTLVSLQFYPHTPVGSYIVHNVELEGALVTAHVIMDELEGK